MLLGWSPPGRKEEGDPEEDRGPLSASTALWGRSEPLCSAERSQRGCGKETAAPVAARGQGDMFSAWHGGHSVWVQPGSSGAPWESMNISGRSSTLSPCPNSLCGCPAVLTSCCSSCSAPLGPGPNHPHVLWGRREPRPLQGTRARLLVVGFFHKGFWVFFKRFFFLFLSRASSSANAKC